MEKNWAIYIKINKLIYCSSEFHVLTIINQYYFISAFTLSKLSNVLKTYTTRFFLLDRVTNYLKLFLFFQWNLLSWRHLQRSSEILFKNFFWFWYVTISSFHISTRCISLRYLNMVIIISKRTTLSYVFILKHFSIPKSNLKFASIRHCAFALQLSLFSVSIIIFLQSAEWKGCHPLLLVHFPNFLAHLAFVKVSILNLFSIWYCNPTNLKWVLGHLLISCWIVKGFFHPVHHLLPCWCWNFVAGVLACIR